MSASTDNIRASIVQALDRAEVEHALELLSELARQENADRKGDIALLRTTFMRAKRQFEIQGLISKAEYDQVFARTVYGIQSFLETSLHGGSLSKSDTGPYDRRMITVLGLLLVACLILAVMWSVPSVITDKEAIDETLPRTNEQSIEQSELPRPKRQADTVELSASPVELADERPPRPTRVKPEPPVNEEVTIPDEPVYFQIKVLLNASWRHAKLYINGKPATLVRDDQIARSVRVLAATHAHRFELRKESGQVCRTEQLITTEGQTVLLPCI